MQEHMAYLTLDIPKGSYRGEMISIVLTTGGKTRRVMAMVQRTDVDPMTERLEIEIHPVLLHHLTGDAVPALP